MGFFDLMDKLANAGARSTMSSELHAAYKDRSQSANALTALATMANGHGVGRSDQRKAQRALIDACDGDERAAERLKKQATKQARRSLFG